MADGIRRDRTVLSALPWRYARYAVLRIPDGDGAKRLADAALVEVLQAHGPVEP